MLEKDDLAAANCVEEMFKDTRLSHYWDSERISGKRLSQTLKIKRSIAWDVYLVYPPKQDLAEELPPTPEFWMHQLKGEDQTLHLDKDALTNTVNTMLANLSKK